MLTANQISSLNNSAFETPLTTDRERDLQHNDGDGDSMTGFGGFESGEGLSERMYAQRYVEDYAGKQQRGRRRRRFGLRCCLFRVECYCLGDQPISRFQLSGCFSWCFRLQDF
jgi:hypothetical protein